jgi:hypothetical protein
MSPHSASSASGSSGQAAAAASQRAGHFSKDDLSAYSSARRAAGRAARNGACRREISPRRGTTRQLRVRPDRRTGRSRGRPAADGRPCQVAAIPAGSRRCSAVARLQVAEADLRQRVTGLPIRHAAVFRALFPPEVTAASLAVSSRIAVWTYAARPALALAAPPTGAARLLADLRHLWSGGRPAAGSSTGIWPSSCTYSPAVTVGGTGVARPLVRVDARHLAPLGSSGLRCRGSRRCGACRSGVPTVKWRQRAEPLFQLGQVHRPCAGVVVQLDSCRDRGLC